MLGACATVVLLCAGSTVTLDVDNKLSRRTVYGGTVHDPLELSVETISVGGTISPVVVRSQTAKSTYWQGRSQAGGGGEQDPDTPAKARMMDHLCIQRLT